MLGSILTPEQEHEREHPWNAQQSCPLKRNKCTILRQRIPQPLPQTCLLLFSTPAAFPFFQGAMNHLIFQTGRYPTISYSVFLFFSLRRPVTNSFFRTVSTQHSSLCFLNFMTRIATKHHHPCFTHPGKQKLLMENQPANDIEAKQKGPQTAGFLFTRFNFDKVPPTGLEPVRPCGQQILSLQRLPFRHEGIDRTALYRNAAGIQARIPSGF